MATAIVYWDILHGTTHPVTTRDGTLLRFSSHDAAQTWLDTIHAREAGYVICELAETPSGPHVVIPTVVADACRRHA